ncbi:hypothetical protein PENTCL1PPCAC_29690, partial [Pristionchus entomophagus]
PRPEEYEQVFQNVKEAFESSDALSDRLAYVSMISHFAHPEIQRHIPSLTRHFLKSARMYSRRGYHIEAVHHGRVKYILRKIERFIEFLTRYRIRFFFSKTKIIIPSIK